jgi:hypothetical protein
MNLNPWPNDGDSYVDTRAQETDDDREVSVTVFHPRPIAAAVAGAGPLVARFVRTPLRWMEPDGKGGLRPKAPR